MLIIISFISGLMLGMILTCCVVASGRKDD